VPRVLLRGPGERGRGRGGEADPHSERRRGQVAAARGHTVAPSAIGIARTPSKGCARKGRHLGRRGDICGGNGELREEETADTRRDHAHAPLLMIAIAISRFARAR